MLSHRIFYNLGLHLLLLLSVAYRIHGDTASELNLF